MIGRVVSTKMKNTAVVLVTSTKTHPLYKKSYKRSKKFLAQDEIGVSLGDLVEIFPIRPVSRKKFWKVNKVVGREYEAVAKEELKEAAKAAIEEVMPEEKESSDPPEARLAKGGISLQLSDKEMKENNEKKKTPRKRKDKSDSWKPKTDR